MAVKKTVKKTTAKPTPKAKPKDGPKNGKKPIELKGVTVSAKRTPTYNSQDSLAFGTAGNKVKYAVKDIKNAVKAKTLSGIDTTNNKTISQSGGKYNRMMPELNVGVTLGKKKKK